MKLILTIFFLFCAFYSNAEKILVKNSVELNASVSRAAPGDIIILANGEWKNANIVVQGRGTAKKPILITAETAGSVILSGTSSLKLSGEFITIKNLHFRDGFTANGDVITFRTASDKLANNCRITGIVIENFSKPDRFSNDNWVVLWGKNNRVDHCTFVNKLNTGPTLVVELPDERSQSNYHSIDSNYFKGRQRLGSNGGETIRIGVSKNSLSPSKTSVRYNYFERCNGEVEVVSVKSGENRIAFNTFFECEGGLVLRHGNNNVVEGNLFLGNNKPFTAGVRVINSNQTVYNNLFKDLKGEDFRSALAVMNGVPNSLINRYHQVKNADIHQNTFINCDNIVFGVGKDPERTAAPEDVRFRNNLLVNPSEPIYKNNNGDSGITFTLNAIANTSGKRSFPRGFIATKSDAATFKGIAANLPVSGIGADIANLPLITAEVTGAHWFKTINKISLRQNRKVSLAKSEAPDFQKLLNEAFNGDTIILTESGIYPISYELKIDKNLYILGNTALKTVLVNTTDKTIPSFFCIENGGSLKVNGIEFNGAFKDYGEVKAGIRSTNNPTNLSYNLTIDSCRFYNFNESSFSGFKAEKSTYADNIVIRNSTFRKISGNAIDLSAEKDDKGIYNAENVTIENCLFTNVLGSALNLYRGGNDESTTGPFLRINKCTFNEVDNREQGSVLRLHGVQNAVITNCIFHKSGQGGRSIYFQEYERDNLKVDNCNFFKSGKIESFYDNVAGPNIFSMKPAFLDPNNGNYNLATESGLKNKPVLLRPLGARL